MRVIVGPVVIVMPGSSDDLLLIGEFLSITLRIRRLHHPKGRKHGYR